MQTGAHRTELLLGANGGRAAPASHPHGTERGLRPRMQPLFAPFAPLTGQRHCAGEAEKQKATERRERYCRRRAGAAGGEGRAPHSDAVRHAAPAPGPRGDGAAPLPPRAGARPEPLLSGPRAAGAETRGRTVTGGARGRRPGRKDALCAVPLLRGVRRRREAVPGGRSRCADAARAPSRREARGIARLSAPRGGPRRTPPPPPGISQAAESAACAAPSAFLFAPSLLRRPGGAVRARSPRPRPAAVGAWLAPPPWAAAGAAPSDREPRRRAPLESPAVPGGRGCRGCAERCVPCPPRAALAAAAPLSAMFPAPLSRRFGIPSSAGWA